MLARHDVGRNQPFSDFTQCNNSWFVGLDFNEWVFASSAELTRAFGR
jgi:hypothetical protein